jgi:hypothetical protein
MNGSPRHSVVNLAPLAALRLQDRPPGGLDREPAEPKPGSSGEEAPATAAVQPRLALQRAPLEARRAGPLRRLGWAPPTAATCAASSAERCR